MKALLIVLLVLFLLGSLPVGIHLVYDGQVRVQLLLWKLRISFPKKKEKIIVKKKEAVQPKPGKKAKPEKKSNVKGWLQAALTHWQDLLALVGKALRTPKLDPLIVHVTAGGDDPADRAMNYGRAWAVLGAVLPVVDNHFRIGQRDVDVRCGEDPRSFAFYVQTDLTVRVWAIMRLAVLGLKVLFQIYQEYQSSQKAVRTT